MVKNKIGYKNIKEIPETAILSSAIDDVLKEKFDITWFVGKESVRTLSILPIEKAIDDGTITYTYNNELFRCDDFTAERDGTHILFAGCSQTEGVGGNIETVWTKILHSSLSENGGVDKFFSISRAGWGWQKIISNFMIYTSKYGFPEYFLVLLPDLCRFFEWDPEKSMWVYVQRQYSDAPSMPNGKPSIFSKPATIEEHKKAFIDFAVGWKLFEAHCKDNNVKLLWGSWDYGEVDNYQRFIKSDSYIHLSDKEYLSFIKSNRPDGKIEQFDLERRDGHEGILAHQYWAEKFKDEIQKRGWLNV
jgi:hypothetical protein